MSVSLSDTSKIPYLTVWASRNGYQQPIYSSHLSAVTVPGAPDATVAAQLSAILTTTGVGVLMAARETETLPAGLSATIGTARLQAAATVNVMAQTVLSYFLAEDEMADANLASRIPIYREVAQGAGTADELAAVAAEILAVGSSDTPQVYAQSILNAFADVRLLHFKLTGFLKSTLAGIALAASAAALYVLIDAFKAYVETHSAGVAQIPQGTL